MLKSRDTHNKKRLPSSAVATAAGADRSRGDNMINGGRGVAEWVCKLFFTKLAIIEELRSLESEMSKKRS